jgi:hypothetical protein
MDSTTIIIVIVVLSFLFIAKPWSETSHNWRKWLVFPSWTDLDGKPIENTPLYNPHTEYPTSYYSPVKRVNGQLLTPDFRASPNQPHYYPYSPSRSFPLYPKLE